MTQLFSFWFSVIRKVFIEIGEPENFQHFRKVQIGYFENWNPAFNVFINDKC